MVKLKNVIERFHVEAVFPMVDLGKGVPLQPNNDLVPEMQANRGEHTMVIRALRLDVVIDDGPDGYARSFANLLAGLYVDLEVGVQLRPRDSTFVNGLVNVVPSELAADLPAMRHGTLLLEKDVQVSIRQGFRAILRYRGVEPIPIAFMRVVALSVGTRDVQ